MYRIPRLSQRPRDRRDALRAKARTRAERSAGAQREPRGCGLAVRPSQHHLQHGSVPDLLLLRLDPSPHFKILTGNLRARGALGYRGVCWMKTSWRSWLVRCARARLERSRFLRSNHQQMSKTSELLPPFVQLLPATRCNRVRAAATVAKNQRQR